MLRIMLMAFAVTLLLSMILVLFLTKVYKKRFDAIKNEPCPEGWHDIAAEDEAEKEKERQAGWLSWEAEAKEEWEDL